MIAQSVREFAPHVYANGREFKSSPRQTLDVKIPSDYSFTKRSAYRSENQGSFRYDHKTKIAEIFFEHSKAISCFFSVWRQFKIVKPTRQPGGENKQA
jgi:hypothetical protein